jgi:hypothetical protein
MLIDIEITIAFEFEIKGAVAREKLQHVIEETDAGGYLVAALAFDGEMDENARLGGVALDDAGAGLCGSGGIPGLRIETWGTQFFGRSRSCFAAFGGHWASLSERRAAMV